MRTPAPYTRTVEIDETTGTRFYVEWRLKDDRKLDPAACVSGNWSPKIKLDWYKLAKQKLQLLELHERYGVDVDGIVNMIDCLQDKGEAANELVVYFEPYGERKGAKTVTSHVPLPTAADLRGNLDAWYSSIIAGQVGWDTLQAAALTAIRRAVTAEMDHKRVLDSNMQYLQALTASRRSEQRATIAATKAEVKPESVVSGYLVRIVPTDTPPAKVAYRAYTTRTLSADNLIDAVEAANRPGNVYVDGGQPKTWVAEIYEIGRQVPLTATTKTIYSLAEKNPQ